MAKEKFNPVSFHTEVVKSYSTMDPALLDGERMFINRAYQVQKAEGMLDAVHEKAFQIRLKVLTELITKGEATIPSADVIQISDFPKSGK